MILPGQLGGKVGRRRDLIKKPHAIRMGLLVFQQGTCPRRQRCAASEGALADWRVFRAADMLYVN